MNQLSIRLFSHEDIPTIVYLFAQHAWAKPSELFETYWAEQNQNERLMWVAYLDGNFAGYVTLKWQSNYSSFCEQKIPEIADLNVLPPFRTKRIGSALLETAERTAFLRVSTVGLGVGLYPGYGAAHRIYIKRGYMPDGLGITYNYQRVAYGSTVILDDDLILWFTKNK